MLLVSKKIISLLGPKLELVTAYHIGFIVKIL